MKCIIIEDELDAVALLKHYIESDGRLSLVATFSDTASARAFMLHTPVDVLFLDIELPGGSGIDFAREAIQQSKIIFTTAFKEFAVDGFELSATDYLLKPFSLERFSRAVSRALEHPEKPSSDSKNDSAFIVVTHERRPTKLYLNDIVFAEAQRNYLLITCRNASYKVHISMSEFCDKLPKATFVRVHRSFVVSTEDIESMSSNRVYIRGHAIPVGRNYTKGVARVVGLRGLKI